MTSSNVKVWHPLLPYNENAIKIYSAKGDVLYTEKGELIDGIGSWWAVILGHRHPDIIEEITKQLSRLTHAVFADFIHEAAENVAKLLGEILPVEKGPWHIFFSDNGSTAIEVAIKGVFHYLKIKGEKALFVGLKNGYHGDTLGAFSFCDIDRFAYPYKELLLDVRKISPSYIYSFSNYNEDEVDVLISNASKLNARLVFLYEPLIQGAGGMLIMDVKKFNEILKRFNERNAILIADEIFTGLYRTGKPLASYYFNTMPDVICLSKAITNGTLPLGITCFSNELFMEFVNKNEYIFHAHTYTGNPLACAAAFKNLNLLLTKEIQERIQNLTLKFQEFALKISNEDKEKKFQVRNCGTILAFNLPPSESYNSFILKKSLINEKKIYLRPLGNVIYICPPYTISESNLNKLLSALAEIID